MLLYNQDNIILSEMAPVKPTLGASLAGTFTNTEILSDDDEDCSPDGTFGGEE